MKIYVTHANSAKAPKKERTHPRAIFLSKFMKLTAKAGGHVGVMTEYAAGNKEGFLKEWDSLGTAMVGSMG